ncbi:MAG TPA: FAD-binding oxidoreductase [Candidatus Binatia bacterium]|nr:FAD-binding oxidoreductase [Candidatus Binatia bacterium]
MSTAGTAVRFARELRDICGAGHVVEDAARLEGARIFGVIPALAVEPASSEEIAAILRFANEHGLNVVPTGGFTWQQTGSAPESVDVLLYTSRLAEVEHYDPGDLTVGVGAGCTVAQLASMVRRDGLLYAADPQLPERTTVGGLLATGVTGPLRHAYGGLRDYCIGIRFVTGDGRRGKGGGRVVKNVAGYDMMKLLIGSWGTLAIITGASFKLFPAPRQTKTFIAGFATSAEAISYRNLVLRSPLSPICLELVSPEAAAALSGSNAAGAWSLHVRATGSDAVLARYRSELGSAISQELEGTAEDERWRAVADFPHTVSQQHPDCLLVALWLALADVQPVLEDLQSVAAGNQLAVAAVGRVGVGHLLAALWPASPRAELVAAASALCERLPADSSMAVLRRPGDAARACVRRTPTDVDSMRAVKQALDPKDILNRGRFSL